MLQKQPLERDDQFCSNASRSKPCGGQFQDDAAATGGHLPSPGDGQMPLRTRSAGAVVDDPEVRRASLAGVREGAQATIAAGANGPVFARTEGLLVAASATAAARAVVYDAVSRAIGHAGVGEGLAIAAATGADRTVFHGADLRPRMGRPRAWRARPRSIVDDYGTGGENYRQQHNGKPMPRNGGR